MTQKTDTDFARALALSLTQVLPIAKRAAQADDVANANANLSLNNNLNTDPERRNQTQEELDQKKVQLDKDVAAHHADTQRLQRASHLLQQFDQTESHVRDLPEDHFDGSFEVKFED